ncbi:MAG: hypothetical protein KIS66_15735 [Fimbriimonadaceae bacterium]|nr:hypothetical protein [Fimbriimonadaceae bacterium]
MVALAGCAAPRESVSIAFDRIGDDHEVASLPDAGGPVRFPSTPRGRVDVGALDGEARGRLQRWRAEIDDYIAALRVHDLRRREEVIRVAFEERYQGDRERVLREHRSYAEDLESKASAAIYRRLEGYADEVAQRLARLATLGLYPNPGEAAMVEEPKLDGREKARRAEGRSLWAFCLAARERYEADVAQILAETSDNIDAHLTELLADLERVRQAWESETPLSRPPPVAGLVQEEGRLREGGAATALPTRISHSPPMNTIRRPDLGRLDVAEPWSNRAALLVEARVFAAQRGYTLAAPRDPGRDVTAEFVAWRNGYRSTR